MSDDTANRIKSWFDRSPIFTVLIALAGVLGFVIASANGIYTLWDKILRPVKTLSVEILRMDFILEPIIKVDRNEIGGLPFTTHNQIDQQAIWANLRLTNPKDEPTTISNFHLYFITDSLYDHWIISDASVVSKQNNKQIDPHVNLPIYLQPKEVKEITVGFVFLELNPAEQKEYKKFLRATAPVYYFIRCLDQDRYIYKARGPHMVSYSSGPYSLADTLQKPLDVRKKVRDFEKRSERFTKILKKIRGK